MHSSSAHIQLSPCGGKFVKGYLYSWNCENLEISLSFVLA